MTEKLTWAAPKPTKGFQLPWVSKWYFTDTVGMKALAEANRPNPSILKSCLLGAVRSRATPQLSRKKYSPDTVARGKAAGLSLADHIARHDAYAYFQAIGDLVVTGPTHTNVNDFRAVLIL